MACRAARSLLLAAVAGFAVLAPAQTDEAKLKAEFLVRFAAYTSWPTRAFAADSSPVVIGIWKDLTFAKTVIQVRGDRTAGGRPIVVKTITSYSEASEAHLLFIPGAYSSDIARLLIEVKRSPILTVSEVAGFCTKGGILNFYKQGAYVRFEANPDAARSAGVQISSQLLKLARIVGGTE
ncbi:MAG: hypothetical protein KatS3mg015_1996 [Fimbriimonadales bacterium]|nr:MAG: hypothetical protein KatS3mg015_1996 [Fimbriimonadales bacterium]